MCVVRLASALVHLSWFFVFSIGSLGQPHVVNKFMMIRDLKVLRFFPLALALSMLLCSLIWLGSGLAVKGLVLGNVIPPLSDPDQTIMVFLKGNPLKRRGNYEVLGNRASRIAGLFAGPALCLLHVRHE